MENKILTPLQEYIPISEEEISAVERTLRSEPLTSFEGRGEIRNFEEEFANKFGAKYGIAMTSGTSVLHAALVALDIGEGDEVIVTPFSFVASVSVVIQTGATPVFVDVDPKTLNMSTVEIRKKITKKTKAILPVHIYGYPADMIEIMEIAKKYDLKVIEDCCQAHGARVNNKFVGTFGDCGCFSFNIGKIIRTGEGGMVITSNKDLAYRLSLIRVNGIGNDNGTWKIKLFGFNYTMFPAIASIGRVQLKKFDRYIERRKELGEKIINSFERYPIDFPKYKSGYERIYYLIPFILQGILKDKRDQIVDNLKKKNVPVFVSQDKLLHKIDYIEEKYPLISCPNIEKIYPSLFHIDPLPIYSNNEVDVIINIIKLELDKYL